MVLVDRCFIDIYIYILHQPVASYWIFFVFCWRRAMSVLSFFFSSSFRTMPRSSCTGDGAIPAGVGWFVVVCYLFSHR